MTSPDGKIRIPLNESQDDKSQIEEFLREYKGEGIQHIALGTPDIYQAVDILRARGFQAEAARKWLQRHRPAHPARPGARVGGGVSPNGCGGGRTTPSW